MHNSQNTPPRIEEARQFIRFVLLASVTIFQVAGFIEMDREMLLVTSLDFAILQKLQFHI